MQSFVCQICVDAVETSSSACQSRHARQCKSTNVHVMHLVYSGHPGSFLPPSRCMDLNDVLELWHVYGSNTGLQKLRHGCEGNGRGVPWQMLTWRTGQLRSREHIVCCLGSLALDIWLVASALPGLCRIVYIYHLLGPFILPWHVSPSEVGAAPKCVRVLYTWICRSAAESKVGKVICCSITTLFDSALFIPQSGFLEPGSPQISFQIFVIRLNLRCKLHGFC